MSELVLEAGCKEKIWIYDTEGNAEHYHYKASGELLERVEFASAITIKIIMHRKAEVLWSITTIEYQQVRDVDAKK